MSRFVKGQPIKINKISNAVKFKIADRINAVRSHTVLESHIQACHDAIEAVYSHSTLPGIMDALDDNCKRVEKVRDSLQWMTMVDNYLEIMETIKQIVKEEVKEV